MSVASLPEWKQLLLEKKRREEEERERREKEEEAKFANMPAWKRGIIQRRKAKQDNLSDKEKDRDICLLQVDARSPTDCLSDTDSFITVNFGSELSLSPDPGQWLDADIKSLSQVSVETIVPFHENLFIRTQSAKRKGRDAEAGVDPDVKEREKDKTSPKSQEGESGRGRDIEIKIERFRDLSEGREVDRSRDRSRDRSQGREQEKTKEGWEKDKSQWKESGKDQTKEQELLKARKEETETDPQSTSSSLVPCLRTIRADNIIIIEQERKGTEERRGRWREAESERPEEDHQGKRGMKMNLREILSGGGCVTEIRASEVLIIKPSVSPEERSPGGGGGGGKSSGREDGEMKGGVDGRRESMCREFRTDMSWLREKEKERPWGHATVIKDDRKDCDDNLFVERGGRVSQLLSKFGEHPKPPSRSKSSDNFLRPGRRKLSDEDDQQSEERKADGRNALSKGVPKRSFSFSDRVLSAKENGLDDNGHHERKTRERIHSDKSSPVLVDLTGTEIKLGYALFLDKGQRRKDRDRHFKNLEEKGGPTQRKNDSDILKHKSDFKKVELFDTRAAEKDSDVDGDQGFTAASVRNTEGISFARRIPIRQDGKARADRDTKQLTGPKSSERGQSVGKDSEMERQTEKVSDFLREEGCESMTQTESEQKSHVAASAELVGLGHTQHRHESAFKECSSLLCATSEKARDSQTGPEWSGSGPQASGLSHNVLSKQTEELISKIEKIGDTTVYHSEKGERACKAAYDVSKECKQEGQTFSDNDSEGPAHNLTPRSTKRIPPMGIPPSPLEIQIPRSVFYVAQEMEEKKKTEGQSDEGKDWEAGKGVERRDSWRIGKPLSRIESLREKIRQRELETLRQKAAEDGGGGEDTEKKAAAGDSHDVKGTEIEKEREGAACMRKRPVEAEKGQEDAAAQTSMTACDVKQEVAVLKTSPQLPVSVPHSQAVRAEEVTSGYATAATGGISDSLKTAEDEDEPLKHGEEQLRHHRSQPENKEKEKKEEEKELSEGKAEDYPLPLDSGQPLSSLSPHPNSLAAMSRIYNLETVGSRSGLCLRERTVEIQSVHLVKVRPLISNAQQSDSKESTGDDSCGVQTIQQQIGQFQLKEQEALKSGTTANNPHDVRGTKGQQSSRGVLKHLVKDNAKTQEKEQETSEPNPKVLPQRACSPSSRLKPSSQTITHNPSLLRSQSPDSLLKSSNCTPTPTCSPSSSSPSQSPGISPCTTPSPTLFSIRSASGGQVKRGATITISPRKPTAVAGSTPGPTTAGSTAPTAEPGKKKYPTVEEIEVIGGYQNLDKSCLVKMRGTPKRGKVCFDEDQLEQLCEYPSETFMLASTPFPHDLWRTERPQSEEAQEEEAEVEVSKGTRSVGISTGRGLRVDESCPR
ncbi:uncharacterized protein ppp1r18 [Notolabrus celidotus]|uniref:uncharacterized protein ppp1r18 n=1 Tax=Notolabrus celidotus TaxID=1203425 RepID=UPI001490496C|nr:uncharacterized protein ppp1r18 [Notolabrus celidotus]